jgi:THO complex subunit 1
VWNLLDLLSILSDDGECDAALLFWLIEELLDSQTIAGCRKIFDFLESRRERIIAKNFKQKQLIILRSCNELLRRLSRAEDTAFCGRVFIFMFQSFPLGDKSSVNLRGEYHVENVTTFDDSMGLTDDANNAMDVDREANAIKGTESKANSKAVSFNEKQQDDTDKPLKADELYPLFWSLQETFSQPKKLFEPAHFLHFKRGLEATLTKFSEHLPKDQGPRPVKAKDDSNQSPKRKRSVDDVDNITNAFNPKYLTSRDLFELEVCSKKINLKFNGRTDRHQISDTSFRRYVLIQAMITMDFLLSLTIKAKEKLSTIKVPNKSVTYMEQQLSEDNVSNLL